MKTIAAALAITFCVFSLGCGTTVAPQIKGIFPSAFSVGMQPQTIKITGTRFTSGSTALWNGNKLTTTMMDEGTLSALVPGSSLSAPGTAQVMIQDALNELKSLPQVVVIQPAALTIAAQTLPAATVGTAYSTTLTAGGGAPGYTWTISSGSSLPAGLSLAASTGVISGMPSAGGAFSFGVTVTDSTSAKQTAMLNLSIGAANVAAQTVSALSAGSAVLPGASVNQLYKGSLSASGGTAPYTWTVSAGSLPAGLSLAPATGVISGTPTAGGGFSFTATVTDSSSPAQTQSEPVSITVASPAPFVPATLNATSALAPGANGTAYSGALQASGGTAPYTWTISGGSLPAGLSLAPSTGTISGTPTGSGISNFTAMVTDSGSLAQTRTVATSINIAAAALKVETYSLPAGTTGSAYTAKLKATGGDGTYTWSATGLPPGLKLSFSGTLSGTPSGNGNASIVVSVKDGESTPQTASATLALSVAAAIPQLTITTSSLTAGTSGSKYSATLQESGGTGPYTWTATGVPSGLSLSSAGVLSGTPSGSGNASIVVSVKDGESTPQTASATLALSVAAAIPQLTITTSSLTAGTSGKSYSATLQASGGNGSYTWTATGVPSGLSLSSAGVLSGTPSGNGNASIAVSVKDGESTPQTASATLALSVAAAVPQLTVSSVTLPVGAQNLSYTGSFTAAGGTAPYTWTITTGGLPSGLSLSSSGAVTGTPTTLGKVTFTATVTDSGTPAQTNSTSTFITVGAAPLTITSTSLASATDGTNYSAPVQASGGTPAYTWSVSAGTLPAGLSLAASTGIISGMPTSTGTSTFTVSVSDNSATPQTQTAQLTISVAAAAAANPGTTWYVRADGGTRYSASATLGQCDGKADSAYSGTGTNQHCAFNDYRFLFDDQSANPSAWVISGGDTIILRNGPWREGFSQGASPADVWCRGGSGPQSCGIPVIPAGTPTQHTRILGENYASCGSHSQMTQIYGGFGLGTVMWLVGAQNVDIQCIELTRHSDCTQHGYPAYPAVCHSDFPFDDFAIRGITTDVTTKNILLQDMWIHGFPDRGVIGPLGGEMTCLRCDISTNGEAGWDFDDGTGSNNGNGTASLPGAVWNFTDSIIEWSGCNQQYPATDAIPIASCFAQNNAGYGDGVGSPPGGCLTTNIVGSTIRYNMQDGIDLGHYDTNNCALKIQNSNAYGNLGGTFKWGAAENPVIFENNIAIANAFRLSQPLTGLNSSVTSMLAADPGDMCRAGDAVSFNFEAASTIVMNNNTVVNYCPTSFDIGCWASTNCSAATFTFQNNLVLGYDNPVTYDQGGQFGGPGGLYYQQSIGNVVRSNNLFYGIRNTTCPTGYPGEICLNPQLVNQPTGTAGNFVESELDNFNAQPTPGSPVIGAGVIYTGIPATDHTGATRPNPPSIGAVEP